MSKHGKNSQFESRWEYNQQKKWKKNSKYPISGCQHQEKAKGSVMTIIEA